MRENPANTPNEDDVADKNVLLLKENHEVEKRGTKSAQNEPENSGGRRVNILENHTSDELITPITKKPVQELPSNYPPQIRTIHLHLLVAKVKILTRKNQVEIVER